MSGLIALVVDDSKTARIALKRTLEKLGVKVEFAESGEAAIEFLGNTDKLPHAIFMDMMMPGMGGLKATQAISTNKATAQICIVMCTSNESDADRAAAKEHGAKDLISKPPIKEQLEEVINSLSDTVGDASEEPVVEKTPEPVVEAPPPVEEKAAPKPVEKKTKPAPKPVVIKPEPVVSGANKTIDAQVEKLVRELTEKFVKEIAEKTAQTVANDTARTTAMNVASSTAKEVANNTAVKNLSDSVNEMAKEVLTTQLKSLPLQVQKLIDQRMGQAMMSDANKASIIEALQADIHGMIDDASAAAEDNAYEAAREAVKKGIAPLKWGFFFLTLMLISSVVVQFVA